MGPGSSMEELVVWLERTDCFLRENNSALYVKVRSEVRQGKPCDLQRSLRPKQSELYYGQEDTA